MWPVMVVLLKWTCMGYKHSLDPYTEGLTEMGYTE